MLRVAALVVALALAVACGEGGGADRAAPTAGADLTRTAEAGGITVEGTWLVAESLGEMDADFSAYPLDRFVLIEIAFTTHSGDLNKVDIERAATLGEGGSDIRPETWISVSDDSHHRAGVLVFKRAQSEGPAKVTLALGDSEVALAW